MGWGVHLRWVMGWSVAGRRWGRLVFGLDDFVHLLHALHQLIEKFVHGYLQCPKVGNVIGLSPSDSPREL